jgi:hypothetical protein
MQSGGLTIVPVKNACEGHLTCPPPIFPVNPIQLPPHEHVNTYIRIIPFSVDCPAHWLAVLSSLSVDMERATRRRQLETAREKANLP